MRKRRSTLPCRSATFLNFAETIAALMTSVATISPSSSFTAFMMRTSSCGASRISSVSLSTPPLSQTADTSSYGRPSVTAGVVRVRVPSFPCVPQPARTQAMVSEMIERCLIPGIRIGAERLLQSGPTGRRRLRRRSAPPLLHRYSAGSGAVPALRPCIPSQTWPGW